MAVSLTAAAADRVRQFLVKKPTGVGLRIGVKSVGCSGLAYVVEVAESIGEGDRVFESNGIKVIVPESAVPTLEGMVVDFRREGMGEAFRFDNPNVKGTCGCGDSFSV